MIATKRKRKYKAYAAAFVRSVREEMRSTAPGKILFKSEELPTISFYRQRGAGEIDGHRVEISGYFNKISGNIEIYNFVKDKPDYVKETIRHECIHFLLWADGLPYEDNTPLFLDIAARHFARPYEAIEEWRDGLEETQENR